MIIIIIIIIIMMVIIIIIMVIVGLWMVRQIIDWITQVIGITKIAAIEIKKNKTKHWRRNVIWFNLPCYL